MPKPKYLFLALSAGFLLSAIPGATVSATGLDNSDPRYPQRYYRRFLLPNQMKVLLISDPGLQRGAASMTVGVGSIHDPPEYQGLAHFLEHMLFLGTGKYPEGGSYQKFVSTHDGFSNAFTLEERTNYHFEIAPSYLEEGLDRFVEFFVNPLFNPELVEREMKAVDSEHSKNLPVDMRRINQLKREVYEAGHPARHFSTGSLETLKRVTRNILIDFYRHEYSSNRMTLAVAGPQDLDTLQDWVAVRFNRVENRGLKPHVLPERYLPHSERFREMLIKTVKDLRELIMIFPLPSTTRYYRSRPLNMLGFLIGHEGRGSLLSLLKQEGLATGLSAGGGDFTSAYSSFEIKIQLTPKGLKRRTKVIQRVFQYIRLLRGKSLPRSVYEEVRRMAEIDYRFDEKIEGTRLVNMFSLLMQIYPLRGVENDPFLITKYRPRLFDSMLFRLIPSNLLVLVAARDVKTDQTEPIYGTEYSFNNRSNELLRKWKNLKLHPKLALPKPNPFLPESLEVVDFRGKVRLTYQSIVGLRREALGEDLTKNLEKLVGRNFSGWQELLSAAGFRGEVTEREALGGLLTKHALGNPVILRDDSHTRIWYQQDFRFRKPKTRIIFRVRSPMVYDSPRNAVLSQLYSDAVSEDLNEIGYPVKLAGMGYSIGVDKKGINLSFSGYSDRILELVRTVSGQLKRIGINRETFEALVEKRLRRYANFSFQQPYQQAFYYRSLLLENPKYSLWDYEREIRSISLKDLKKFASRLYGKTFIEGFIYGNLWSETAEEAVDLLSMELKGGEFPKAERLREGVIQINPGTKHTLVKKMEIENSAAVIEVQLDQTSPRLRSTLMVLDTALQPEFYNELRTGQQLGYIVNSGMTELEKTLSLIFLVQSGKYDAVTLEQKIDAFLPGFFNRLTGIPEEELETLKESVVNGKLQKATSISTEAGRLFNIAFEYDARFDYNSEEISAVEKLKREDLRRLIRNYLLPERMRSLVLRMVGQEHQSGPVQGNRIESVQAFRKGYPCPQSCLP